MTTTKTYRIVKFVDKHFSHVIKHERSRKLAQVYKRHLELRQPFEFKSIHYRVIPLYE